MYVCVCFGINDRAFFNPPKRISNDVSHWLDDYTASIKQPIRFRGLSLLTRECETLCTQIELVKRNVSSVFHVLYHYSTEDI